MMSQPPLYEESVKNVSYKMSLNARKPVFEIFDLRTNTNWPIHPQKKDCTSEERKNQCKMYLSARCFNHIKK